MIVSDLPTPCILIDRTILQRNLERMQQLADANQVSLRPHIKTHKSVELAKLQRELGATGITAAKPSEAEVFVEAGFDDIRLAYSVAGRHRLENILSLAERARVSFCLDTLAAAQQASSAFSQKGATAEVLIEIDTGGRRCGITWDHEDLPDQFAAIAGLPGIKVIGLLTHAGQSYKGPDDDALRQAAVDERGRLLSAASALKAAGVLSGDPADFELSIGSTPSMKFFEQEEKDGFRITEIRPGNYVFHDVTQVGLGSAKLADCALTVNATVISLHRDPDGTERVFLDAGRKILTSDTAYGRSGYGLILHSPRTMKPLPHASITGLSEEHGWVSVSGGSTFEVGDRVRIVPNHACVVVNTQRQAFVVEGEEVVDTWAIDAQSMVL